MTKKIFAFLLAVCLCVSSSGMETVWAAQTSAASSQSENVAGHTEDLLWNEVELTQEETRELLEQEETVSEDGTFQSKSIKVRSAVYSNDWDQYSTNYIYNQLPSDYREIWDQLDAVCLKYLTTEVDATAISADDGETYYAIDQIKSSTLSTSILSEIALLFKYSNPQYYFLNDYVYYGSSGFGFDFGFGFGFDFGKRTSIFTIGIYSEFASGTSRTEATKRVKSQLESWESALSSCKSDYEIALAAHDLINDKVTYDEEIDDRNYDEDSHYSQSAYSALCTDLTVCAGYTLAYEMIMNAMGVDCIGVTSDYHAWNKVILEDNWYNVDCTWDDTGGKYLYFARNNQNIISDGYHTPSGLGANYLPACTLDSGSDENSAGVLPSVSNVVETPRIYVSKGTNGYVVTIKTGTQGADIYYTTDGTTPSCAATRSDLYSGSFTVTEGTCVRAVAVADRALDSAEVSVQVQAGLEDSDANSGSNTDTQIPDSNTDTQTPDSNTDTQTPDSDTDTQTPDSSTGTQTPDSDTDTQTPDSSTGTQTPDSSTGMQTPGSSTGMQTPGNSTGMQTPGGNSGIQIPGGSSDTQTPGGSDTQSPGSNDTQTPNSGSSDTAVSSYTITYSLNGGTNNAANPSSYDGTQTITLKDPKKTGYTFDGWYTSSDYSATLNVITPGTAGNLTLYAKWVPNTYKIVFKGNGSTKGSMAKLSCKYGKSYKLKANKFKRTGYTFTGWNTKANGKGTSYKNKASVKNLTKASGKKIVLYAQWKKNK
jgi:uncharacterized repeat protein (TIGR02543 family)